MSPKSSIVIFILRVSSYSKVMCPLLVYHLVSVMYVRGRVIVWVCMHVPTLHTITRNNKEC